MRPRYHFTAQKGWLNDPNGLAFFDGKYHLFFQHNPYGTCWATMHWGHATSSDLLNWTEHEIALYPKPSGDSPYSGCAVIDHNNVSGFAKNGETPMLLFFTSTARGECIAYSLDGGKTIQEYERNPIIPHHGRDPKVIFHEESSRWILVCYDEMNYIAFYSSTNLLDWRFESRIHGFYECPDFYKLDGKWILTAANGTYSIGSFDGHEFVAETLPQNLFTGHNYAGQSYDNIAERVVIFWMKSKDAFGDAPYNQQMSLPVKLRCNGEKILVKPYVHCPAMVEFSSPESEFTIHGYNFQPAKKVEFLSDSKSIEVFTNDEDYFAETKTFKQPRILCFGEVLYDVYPDQKKLGGAPLNLTVHLARFGAEASLISAVGSDELGEETLAQLANLELDCRYIATVDAPTGQVKVELDANSVPHYNFAQDSAYNLIPNVEIDGDIDLFCYGSMALWSKENLDTWRKLCKSISGKFFFDINLRENFYSKDILEEALNQADILKITDNELAEVCQLFNLTPELETIANKFNISTILYTLGAEGSVVYHLGEKIVSPAPEVQVIDTTGGGDGFSAGVLYHLFSQSDLAVSVAAGRHLAGQIISQQGAF